MKTKKYVAKLFLLVAVVSIYSCGTTSDFSIFQRKYNPGYNISLGKKVNAVVTASAEKQVETNNEQETNTTASTPVTEEIIKSENPAVEPTSTIALVGKATAKAIEKTSTASIQSSSIENKHNLVKSIALKKASKVIFKMEKKNKSNASGDVSNETILLIILSLFPILALVAIYLKDGKSITTNFWIDLLLHFIFLYWLFALLVVLDVINLA